MRNSYLALLAFESEGKRISRRGFSIEFGPNRSLRAHVTDDDGRLWVRDSGLREDGCVVYVRAQQ